MKSPSQSMFLLSLLTAAAIGAAVTWAILERKDRLVIVVEQPGDEESRNQGPRSSASEVRYILRSGASHKGESSVARREERLAPESRSTEVSAQVSDDAEELKGLPVTAVDAPRVSAAVTQQVHSSLVVPSTPVFTRGETPGRSNRDAALSFAIEAAGPYVEEGFTLREDYWGGDLPERRQKAIVHQLFHGHEYWFWMGTDVENARVSVHVYDTDGNLAETQAWKKKHTAAAHVVPESTGPYYLIVEVEKSPVERTAYALTYGYR